MSSNDVPEKSRNSEKPSRSLWQRLVLAFFTLFGGVTFFALIFLAIYLHFFVSTTTHKTPIADGRQLYENMQKLEKEKSESASKALKTKRMRKFVKASRGRLRAFHDSSNRK